MDEIVYVLINEAMPGYVKIGLTSGSLEERIRSLDTTGVPLPSLEFLPSSELLSVVQFQS